MKIDAVTEGRVVAERPIDEADDPLVIELDLPSDAKGVELRTWSGRCAFVLEDLSLRALSADPAPRAPPR